MDAAGAVRSVHLRLRMDSETLMPDPAPPPWHRWLPHDRLDWMLIATAAMSEGLLVFSNGWVGGVGGLLVFAFFVVLAASR